MMSDLEDLNRDPPRISEPRKTGRTELPSNAVTAESPSEIDLIREAQDLLRTDPARALAIAERHRTHFPTGALAEEREVIAIDALCRLGRLAEAKTRADDLR